MESWGEGYYNLALLILLRKLASSANLRETILAPGYTRQVQTSAGTEPFMQSAALVLSIASVTLLCSSAALGAESQAQPVSAQQAVAAYGRLPLGFTANQGQADPRIAFLAASSGGSIQLMRESVGFTLTRGANLSAHTGKSVRQSQPAADESLRVSLAHASPDVSVSGLQELPGKSNYLVGKDPSKWHIGIPTYAQVKYASVYPGVDMVCYGSQNQLEFDFVVQPHADADLVRLDLESGTGAQPVHLAIDKQGNLITAGPDGEVLLHRPVLYQVASDTTHGNRKHIIDGGFILEGEHEVGFRVGAYDPSKPLVIDPTLAYSFLRPDFGVEAIAVDPAGNAYIAEGAAVSKLNPSGSALLYTTQLGANVFAIAVDPSGNAYVAGRTEGADVPTTPGAFQTQLPFYESGFVTKLNPTGSSLMYSTFLGGSLGESQILGIAVDSSGAAYVTGETASPYFPVTSGVLQPDPSKYLTPYSSVFEAFATKLNPSGSALVYSTYLGGTAAYNVSAEGIAVDPSGDAFIAGTTSNPATFPTTSGAFSKVGSGYVVKLDPEAKSLLYSTLLKGSEQPASIAIDASGAAYVAGAVVNNDLPVTPGAFQTTCVDFEGSCAYAFALKLNGGGSGLVYSTYLGTGPAVDPQIGEFQASTTATRIAVDEHGDAFVAGFTDSQMFPTTPGALQTTPGTGTLYASAFLTKFNSAGTALLYSTYLGAGDVFGQALAVDPAGNAYIGGELFPPSSFPTSSGALQSVNSGGSAVGFLSKFSFAVPFCDLHTSLQVASNQGQQGFALQASLALGTSAPLLAQTDDLAIAIGNQSVVIPPGSLMKTKNGYSFEGTVDGVNLLVILEQINHPGTQAVPNSVAPTSVSPSCSSAEYALLAIGHGGSLGTLTNPVPVTLSIGSNSGSTETTAKFEP